MMCWHKSMCWVLLLVLSTLLFICSGNGASSLVNAEHFSGGFKGVEDDILSWNMKRSLLEEVQNGKNSSLVLAAERTHRKDPLRDGAYYTGGWNISDKHYLTSVVYSASPLLLAAIIWFPVIGFCLLVSCFWFCCCHRRGNSNHSRFPYALSLILLSIFTIASIVGSIVLYTGQGKFHGSTTDTLYYVVSQSDSTVENLRNVSDYLGAAKQVQVDQVSLPSDVKNRIDQIDSKIDSAADTLESETDKNKNHIMDILDVVRKILIVEAAIMLFLTLLGIVFSALGLQCLVYILVVLGWILVTVTLILSAVFLALYNATGDTCMALDQWAKNPTAHTALDDILPCVDTATAQETLSQSKNVTYQLVGMVNGIISNVSNINPPANNTRSSPLYYNQSGPLVPVLCNPFNQDKSVRKCASGEVEFANATEVWKNFICQVSGNDVCTTVGRLTPRMYQQMSSAVNVSYGLSRYSPFLANLMDCTFVRDTFKAIHDDHCPDLKLYSKWIYIGLAMVASAVGLSLLFWLFYSRHRHQRKYAKLDDARSYQQSSSSFDNKRPQ